MSDRILTLDEAAEFLQVSPGTIKALLDSKVVAGRLLEGTWRTTERALLSYVDGGVGTMVCCPTDGSGASCCSGEPGCC